MLKSATFQIRKTACGATLGVDTGRTPKWATVLRSSFCVRAASSWSGLGGAQFLVEESETPLPAPTAAFLEKDLPDGSEANLLRRNSLQTPRTICSLTSTGCLRHCRRLILSIYRRSQRLRFNWPAVPLKCNNSCEA